MLRIKEQLQNLIWKLQPLLNTDDLHATLEREIALIRKTEMRYETPTTESKKERGTYGYLIKAALID